MADGDQNKKKRRRLSPRYQMEINFPDEDQKKRFLSRLDTARGRMSSRGLRGGADNYQLLSTLLDHFEQDSVEEPDNTDNDAPTIPGPKKPLLKHSGIYTGENKSSDGEDLFVCEREVLYEMVAELAKPCDCRSFARKVLSVNQIGHVLRVEFQCQKCRSKQWWASSRVFGGRYLINQKLVHAFTCAGILPSQYIHFCEFAGVGTIGKWYIQSVYKSQKYMEIVSSCVDVAFIRAVDEVKTLPEYSQVGEWVITDARHDSTANAYHTTVPCLSGSTHKIVGCVTLSRKDHTCAQTRELARTKLVLPQVISKGVNVVEVAHDNNSTVKNYIVNDLNLVNLYDTWHGTKNVAKSFKKISVGALKNAGKTWFPELSDKRKSTKVHLYYCMKNCDGSPDILRANILNIVEHYKGNHEDCRGESACKKSGYSPTKVKLENADAVAAYTKQLQQTLIYSNADSYCHNENVGRAATSECFVQDMRRPDRRTPFRVLVKKSFHFVDTIWKMFVQINCQDIRPIEVEPVDIVDENEEADDLIDDGLEIGDDYDEDEV